MRVFLISGKAESGKNTFASILQDKLENTLELAFADDVKVVAAYIGWNTEKDCQGRKLLQDIGTVVREYDQNAWVKRVIYKIRNGSFYDFENFIITDCRYVNEIEEIKKIFPTTTIRIERFGYDNGLTEEQKMHESETALDTYEFDYVVHNNDTVEALASEGAYIKAQFED